MVLEAVQDTLAQYNKERAIDVIKQEIDGDTLSFSQAQKEYLVNSDINTYEDASETQFLFGAVGVNNPEVLSDIYGIDVNDTKAREEAWVKRMGEYLGDVTAKLEDTLKFEDLENPENGEIIAERTEILRMTVQNYRVMFTPDENGPLGRYLHELSRDVLRPLQQYVAENDLKSSQNFPYTGTDYFKDHIEPEQWQSLAKQNGFDPERNFEA